MTLDKKLPIGLFSVYLSDVDNPTTLEPEANELFKHYESGPEPHLATHNSTGTVQCRWSDQVRPLSRVLRPPPPLLQ